MSRVYIPSPESVRTMSKMSQRTGKKGRWKDDRGAAFDWKWLQNVQRMFGGWHDSSPIVINTHPNVKAAR